MMKTIALPMAAAAALLTSPLLAQERWVEVGMLNCTGTGGLGLILVSHKEMTCTFTPTSYKGPSQAYAGTISKYGVDVGATGRTVLSWLVVAPTNSPVSAGSLSGNYVGASAEATAVIGAGTSVLFGGSHQTYMLQPISVQGQSGVNVAVGVSQLILRGAG